MLLECENCGAPLDIASGATTSKCHYCGKTSQVTQLKTVADVTPQGWAPPTHWTPPSHTNLPQIPLAFRPARLIGRIVTLWITLGIFGAVATAIVPFVMGLNRAAQAPLSAIGASAQMQNAIGQALGAITSGLNQTTGARTVPVICQGVDQLTLNGQTLSLPSGVPVIAGGNCSLRLVNCTVVGATAVSANANAQVTIEGGTIRGGGPALVVTGNATADVSGGAHLEGDATVTVSGNASVTLRSASVVGRHVAIHTSGEGSVNAAGATVQGLVAGTRRVLR